MADWVELAVVTQPHGVRGEVKVKSFTDPDDGFAEYALTDASGAPVALRITGQAQGLFIVRIQGVTDRNAAERWRGRKLGVAKQALKPVATEDRFYVTDLEGMDVVDAAGKAVGHVRSVVNFGAGDLLEITFGDGRSDYYTFTDANFPALDMDARRITFVPPEILGSKAEEEGGA